MKIGIDVGCAQGGMMDDLGITDAEPDAIWQPEFTVEVTDQEWADWQEFLKLHNKWESFWEQKLEAAEKEKYDTGRPGKI